jgi:hypothetical protein
VSNSLKKKMSDSKYLELIRYISENREGISAQTLIAMLDQSLTKSSAASIASRLLRIGRHKTLATKVLDGRLSIRKAYYLYTKKQEHPKPKNKILFRELHKNAKLAIREGFTKNDFLAAADVAYTKQLKSNF